MNKDEAKAIWDKYLQGKASAEEQEFINSWYNHLAEQQPRPADDIDWDLVKANLDKRLPIAPATRQLRTRKLRYTVAFASMLAIAVGITLYLKSPTIKPIPQEMINKVIVSGGNKATLKLADGKVVTLSENKEAIIMRDGKNYYADGSLVSGGDLKKDVVQNLEISVPNGGQYQIVLADGTKVWLNASSSLKYPSSFASAEERNVELSGEAYFEVAPDPKKPFYVKSDGQTVRVFGTHFNVNAYTDEPAIRTTLLEGKVAVGLPSGETKNILPGQQSIVRADRQEISVRQVDPTEVLDWKNGDFTFDNASIETIMRKIARWYDVDVVFQGKITQTNFGGVISRSKNITEVLQLLEMTDAVHFKYETIENKGRGRRIVVMP